MVSLTLTEYAAACAMLAEVFFYQMAPQFFRVN